MINRRPGTHVEVVDKDTGFVLFTGTVADTSPPWVGWSRVIPDHGYVDLPPMYLLRRKTRRRPRDVSHSEDVEFR